MPTFLNDPLVEDERQAAIWMRDKGLSKGEIASALLLGRLTRKEPIEIAAAITRIRSSVHHVLTTIEPK